MTFIEANTAYEAWLRTRCDVVETDLDYKHKRMAKDAFHFLRATSFRWAGQIETCLPDVVHAPSVLSVGDCHVENFGTWRDRESRLVWGINDFDDAAVMPYTLDLVRLATSARLADKLAVAIDDAAGAILKGYIHGLEQPRPALIDETERWIRKHVSVSDDDRREFWHDIDGLLAAQHEPDLEKLLCKRLPTGATVEKIARRPKQGGGSLGRPRFVVVAHWRGGRVVREGKALVASSWDYAHGNRTAEPRFLKLARGSYRAYDPFLNFENPFIVRRIWPDARKIDLGRDPDAKLTHQLLKAMGRDIGAIHAASHEVVHLIKADLAARPDGWLHDAAKSAQVMVENDFKEWHESRK